MDGICAIGPEQNATVTQAGETMTYEGLAFFKKDFFAYQLIGTSDEGNPDSGPSADPLLIFAGKGYNFAAPSGKLYTFQLAQDVSQQEAFGPFASNNSSPTTEGDGFVSPLMLLEKDSGSENDPSHAVWLQTNFFVGTDPNKHQNPSSTSHLESGIP